MRLRRSQSAVLISAHRMGAGGDRSRENSLGALEDAVALGVDYVEFDVWRRDDGSFVVAHDPAHDVGLTYDAVLSAIGARALAHIDLKFISPGEAYDAGEAWEVDAARRAVESLGQDRMAIDELPGELTRRLRAPWRSPKL